MTVIFQSFVANVLKQPRLVDLSFTNEIWGAEWYRYANALLGTFRDYTEIDAFSEVQGVRDIVESYVQDTWKMNRRVTFEDQRLGDAAQEGLADR